MARRDDFEKVFADLEAEVSKNTTVDGSAILLLDTLAAEIEEAKNDPVRIQAIVDKMRADNQTLADAVSRNTTAGSGEQGPQGEQGEQGPQGEQPPV